jgi:hypothetical protein
MVIIYITGNSINTITTMKKLIIIQNDFPQAGKTSLAQSMHSYLENHRVPHHSVLLTESHDESRNVAQIEAEELSMSSLIKHLDRSELVIMEIETGLSGHFNKFFDKNELGLVLSEMDFAVTVAVPVTGEEESFEGVIAAAEAFSDDAQYLIVHTPSSSFYDDDERLWEHSYAARVMDMFEAADVDMPPTSDLLEAMLAAKHTDLTSAMVDKDPDQALAAEITKWNRRAAGQIDSVRKYAFGDGFRPGIVFTPAEEPKKVRKPRSKALSKLVEA